MSIRKLAVLSVILLGAVATSARAEEFANKIPDRVWVDLGGSTNELTTDVTLAGKNGLGASVNFEDVFDLPGNKTTFTIQGTVRVSEKRRWVDFGYVKIDRSGGRQLQQDLEWGDYFFSAGATVQANFNTEFIYGAFRYDFLHEDKIRISGSAGASWTNLGAGVDGNASLNGGAPQVYDVQGKIGVPVPLVGLNLDWAIAKGLVIRSYNRFFRVKASNIDGGMYENGVHLNWYFIKNLGIGLGLDRYQVKINEYTTSEGNKAKFGYTITGLGLYATLAF
ncbi:MAG TPA: hypothetical protein VFV19_01745 [Candidatus Polarisedimenticolaceae bacterium]|nr:hypothetical protein [Candidatus Polarisedimenticolaceae bacterium]